MENNNNNNNIEKTEAVDGPLHSVGFVLEELSPQKVSGHIVITEKSVQAFKVLHGGVSALIAEAMASIGAHMASGFKRVAGIHLSIHHHRSASIGDIIHGEATPISIGKTLQVWEVRLSKKLNDDKYSVLVASSKVTLLCNLPVPPNAKDADQPLKKFARL